MQTGLFLVVLGCLYFATLFSFRFWLKKTPGNILQQRLQPAIAVYLCASSIAGLIGTLCVWGIAEWPLYVYSAGSLILVLYMMKLWPYKKLFWTPFVCLIGTYLIFTALPTSEITLWKCLGAFFAWLLVMWIVMFFDRLPFLSFLTMTSWTMAMTAVGLSAQNIPMAVVVMSVVVFIPLLAISNGLFNGIQAILGPYGSTLLAFVMGGMMATCIASQAYVSATVFVGYYLFEGLLFLMAYLGLHPLQMQKGDFALTTMCQQKSPSFVIKTIFYHELILALLAALTWPSNHVGLLVLAAIVLFHLYREMGTPTMTMKQMWQETKKDVRDLCTTTTALKFSKTSQKESSSKPKIKKTRSTSKRKKKK